MVGRHARSWFAAAVIACALLLSGGCELFVSPLGEAFVVPLPESLVHGAWIDTDDYETGTGFAAYMDGTTFQAVRFDWVTGEIVGAAVGFGGPAYAYGTWFQLDLSAHATFDTVTRSWDEGGPDSDHRVWASLSDGEIRRVSFSYPDSSTLATLFGDAYAERVSTTIPSLRTTTAASVGTALDLEPAYIQGGEDIVDVEWTVMSAPDPSTATVVATAGGYSFTPDVAGSFLLRLVGEAETYRTPPGLLTIEVGL